MAFFGILIEREYDIPLLIFTEKKEITTTQIIGFNLSLPEDYETIFLDHNGKNNNFILLNKNSFVYSKISLAERKVIDYQYRTFWFSAKSYKILRDLFYVREVNKQDYSLRFIEVLSYF